MPAARPVGGGRKIPGELIDEAINNDRDVHRKVVQLARPRAATPEMPVPYTALGLNPEELQKLKVFVSSLRKSVGHKAQLARTVATEWVNTKTLDKRLFDLSNVVEITAMCNFIAEVYRKAGLTERARLAMKSVLSSMQENVEKIARYLSAVMYKVVGTRHLAGYLHALSVYKLIPSQLQRPASTQSRRQTRYGRRPRWQTT